jgi:hypothetical protein
MSLGKTPRPIKLDECNHAAKPPEHIFPEPLGLQRALRLIAKCTCAWGERKAKVK